MSIVVPAILPKSRDDLEEKLARFDGLVDSVQIDVVDGRFVLLAPQSWPYGEGSEEFAELVSRGGHLPHWGGLTFDIDLMVANPEEVAGIWVAAGASRITVHAESTNYLDRFINDFRTRYGHEKDFAPGLLSLGLALSLETDIALIEPFMDRIDYVQFMGIARIGRQGQPFDKRVLPKIRALRKKYPDFPIQVDGGVSLATAPALLAAGVDRLIAGSALMKAEDLKAELEKFEALAQQHGTYE